MAERVTVWDGDPKELTRLRAAIEHNCTCVEGQATCPAHKMLTDQNALNHLEFARSLHDKLERGEHGAVGNNRG